MAFFSSYLPGYATIPDGSDIAEWLSQNALPEDKGEVALDLVENGHYTLNANATFGNAPVTIRTASSNRATITVGNDASFKRTNGKAASIRLTKPQFKLRAAAVNSPLFPHVCAPSTFAAT